MPSVPDFSAEKSLLLFITLNAAVFGSAWRFAARRITKSRAQALLDAALIGYAIQYVSIGLTGLLGCLNLTSVASTAIVCVICLLAASWKTKPAVGPIIPMRDRLIVGGLAIFVIAFVLGFAHTQADLPVISNDAMTYHFPAAVQWLQQGRISLFQTWFFNPANTYSPLAGSIFILWLILPFGSDVLARFVEVPALLCIGLAMFQLCRLLGARNSIAAMIAAAAVCSRPLFLPCMMGKDDLFVAFFTITALVALSKEHGGPIRFGIALGLLLATKYTALLAAPVLLLAIDEPRWPVKKWMVAVCLAIGLAGPWYLRNLLLTGNPIFPMGSLFTTARSQTMRVSVVLGGQYGLPIFVAVCTLLGWIVSFFFAARRPLLRACTLGAAAGMTIFFWRSPFPEIRFVLPFILLMFASTAFSIRRDRLGFGAVIILVASVITIFPNHFRAATLPFLMIGSTAAAIGVAAIWWIGNCRVRAMGVGGLFFASVFYLTYVNWTAYSRDYLQNRFDENSAYASEYPEMNQLWRFVDQHLPANAIVAYTNLYFVYPLQGDLLQRRLVYVPPRAKIKSIADLGWLGRNLSGEQLIPAAVRATVASPDRTVWIKNLRSSRAEYLVVGQHGAAEEKFATDDPASFTLLFNAPAGSIFQVNLVRSSKN